MQPQMICVLDSIVKYKTINYMELGKIKGMGMEWFTMIKDKIMNNHILHSFLIFSIFRAFYGFGILIVTWLLFTNENIPKWFSIVFLLFSMIFSRFIFKKFIKSRNPS